MSRPSIDKLAMDMFSYILEISCILSPIMSNRNGLRVLHNYGCFL